MQLLPVVLPAQAHPFAVSALWGQLCHGSSCRRRGHQRHLSSVASPQECPRVGRTSRYKESSVMPACLREEQGYNAKGKGYQSHQLLKTQLPSAKQVLVCSCRTTDADTQPPDNAQECHANYFPFQEKEVGVNVQPLCFSELPQALLCLLPAP